MLKFKKFVNEFFTTFSRIPANPIKYTQKYLKNNARINKCNQMLKQSHNLS